MSLLVAWIVARLRRRNFKKLQGQDCKSIKSEKFVEGVEGEPGAGHGGEEEDMAQGDSPYLPLSSLKKGLLAAGQGGRATGALGGSWSWSPPTSVAPPTGPIGNEIGPWGRVTEPGLHFTGFL